MSEKEFIDLIDIHQGIIHKVCRLYTDKTHDYEDLFQEIMMQLWQSLPRYQGKAKVSTYMYKIALFTALNRVKSSKKQLDRSVDIPENIPEESIESHESILAAAIQHLNASEKALVSLYLDEKDYKEMAEILGITESNVGVKLNRIKKKLRRIFKVTAYGS